MFEPVEQGRSGAKRVVLVAAGGENPEAVFGRDDEAREVLVACIKSTVERGRERSEAGLAVSEASGE